MQNSSMLTKTATMVELPEEEFIPSQDESSPEMDTRYHSIFMAVDSSDHSNRATDDAIELGKLYQSLITASHVYAAQMHDMRFKQMEGGLPSSLKKKMNWNVSVIFMTH